MRLAMMMCGVFLAATVAGTHAAGVDMVHVPYKGPVAAVTALPTVAEAGVPGYEIVAWQGVFAPAGTPPEIINKLSADIIAVLGLGEIRQALSRQGLETIGGPAAELGAYIKDDLVKWARVVRQANVRID